MGFIERNHARNRAGAEEKGKEKRRLKSFRNRWLYAGLGNE